MVLFPILVGFWLEEGSMSVVLLGVHDEGSKVGGCFSLSGDGLKFLEVHHLDMELLYRRGNTFDKKGKEARSRDK